MWRNVSFVHSMELQFGGNVLTQSMDLGDVDNDGEHELVVGNMDGDLAIFKGDSNVPTKKATNLGMITCVRIGDILNIGKNLLVCLNGEGCCSFFDLRTANQTEEDLQGVDEGHVMGSPVMEGIVLQPVYTQNLPANSRAMLIKDTDGDGLIEMAVTYCDRVVRTFRWVQATETGGSSNTLYAGHLQMVDKWQLAGQIGALTMDHDEDGKPELLVSQPGRTYVTLIPHSSSKAVSTNMDAVIVYSEDGKTPSFVFHPLGQNRVRNKDITTVIVGGIQRGGNSKSTYHALASLDGSLVLVEKDKILWSIQVDHRLFALEKLDVTGNGQEEVVCCSWDGQTYIINHSRDVVRHHFNANVAAFAAGYYHVPGKGNVPCFVYGTFTHQLHMFHSINLPGAESTSLLTALAKNKDARDVFAKLEVDVKNPDGIRSLSHSLLYGWKRDKK